MTLTSSQTQSSPDAPARSPLVGWLAERWPALFEQGLGGLGRRHLRWLLLLVLFLSLPLVVTPLEIWQQGIVAFLLLLIGNFVVRAESRQAESGVSEQLHLLLICISAITTLRYLYYRASYTLNLDTWLDGFFSILLYAAELYAIATLLLSYFQTLKLKHRRPVDLAQIPLQQWFNVDVYIPTYNEDVEIVRKTVLGALALDYPSEKKQVYVLDDGRALQYRDRRVALRQMCQELGCTLLTRDNNDHAKAGNINTAFRRTGGDLVLILDCDHIPSRQFLKHTVGFFYDPQVSLVQTPHWFYNPDPFERNLLTQGQIPVGNELFYKVLQKGNDFWNAAFFCGSAAVVRKAHILEIGGIATETVTEDCHTSLRLHALGYKSVYYDKIMVAGLAPETFSAYVGQQVRWARGMAQILRLENPLFHRRLDWAQRICYFSATSHFFFGFPRLMYAIAPTLFLLFGINPIRGLGVETLAYALPHILLAMQANHIPHKHVRFSFWNEIFEFAMSFQAGLVTLLALVNPKLGSFNVTDKGVSVTQRSFNWQTARPLLIVTILVGLSLVAVPFWLILRPNDREAVLINGVWCLFNLILLIAALLVAFEQPQLRRSHRLQRQLAATLYSHGNTWSGTTLDVSETGARIILDAWPNIPEEVEVELMGDFGARAFLKANVIRIAPFEEAQVLLVLSFQSLSRSQQDALCCVLYSDVQEWYGQARRQEDQPLQSLKFVATSLSRSLQDATPARKQPPRKRIQTPAQLYWNGQFYNGTATALGLQTLRIEMDATWLPDWSTLASLQPVVGCTIQHDPSSAETRLLAQVAALEELSQGQIAVELNFPAPLRQRQRQKIERLLATLASPLVHPR